MPVKPGLQVLALLTLLGTVAPAAAGETRNYLSDVPVVNVEPIKETLHESVSRTVCTDPDDSAREFRGPAATMGADIRGQNRLWKRLRRCRTVTERRPRQRVVAYRVTYRYGGRTATTRLPYDPGERMRVDVRLSPLP
jgi:uncharacterized protein YcfJ